MTKVYPDYETRQKKIRDLETRLYIIEKDINDYHEHRNCVFWLSLCFTDEIIKRLYSTRDEIRRELKNLRRV